MPKTEKAIPASNYTESQEAELKKVYLPKSTQAERDDQLKTLADSQKRSVASIRMKLVNMGIFVKKGKVTKSGEKVQNKAAIISELATVTGESEHFFRSLENVTKDVLLYVLAMSIRDTAALAEEIEEEAEEKASVS